MKGVLWRGLKDLKENTEADFLKQGGAELATCSTSQSLEVAVKYAIGQTDRGLIFCVHVDNALQAPGNLQFLSCFPHEQGQCRALCQTLQRF